MILEGMVLNFDEEKEKNLKQILTKNTLRKDSLDNLFLNKYIGRQNSHA